jgi:anti-anti-sigma factor
MSLSVDCRPCGKVYVVKCLGRIVTGEEASLLEAAINRGMVEFSRVVLQASDVTRVDSTGMGLLVRFLSHTRSRGGDFRLAAPQPFLTTLLQLTKLSTIFRVYDSEEEAIVSFLKEPATVTPGTKARARWCCSWTNRLTCARLCEPCFTIMATRSFLPAASAMPRPFSARPRWTTSCWDPTARNWHPTMW